MTDRRDGPSASDGAGDLSRVTAACMVAALAAPVVAILLSLVTGEDGPAYGWLIPPALGILGAVAALVRRGVGWGSRVAFAFASFSVGIASVGLTFVLATLVLGP